MRDKLSEATAYALITIAGSFSPLIFTAFYLKFSKTPQVFPEIKDIAGRGEIAIICIPIGISIIYSLYTTKGRPSYLRFSDFIFWITLFFSGFAILFYGLTIAPNASYPNIGLLKFSYWFALWSLVALFAARIIEKNRGDSVTEARNQSQKALEGKFDKSSGNQGQ